jgi:antitoxin (DNA-binding transcriptional repressor) of toxin-antitoxin stability system
MSVKHVGVRELRADLAEKLKGSEPIVIERHGQVLGIYVPVQRIDRAKAAEALEQFHAVIDRIVRESDITREELAEAFMAERDEDEPDD